MTTVVIFVSEALIMFLLLHLPPLPGQVEALFDALVLSVLVFPILYLCAFRPLVRHITERKRAEEALRESGQQFRNLIEGSIQGILIHRDHKPLFVNQTWAAIHGYTTGEILAMESNLPLITPHDQQRLVAYTQAPVCGGKTLQLPMSIKRFIKMVPGSGWTTESEWSSGTENPPFKRLSSTLPGASRQKKTYKRLTCIITLWVRPS
jgi:PAS domain-containing protein